MASGQRRVVEATPNRATAARAVDLPEEEAAEAGAEVRVVVVRAGAEVREVAVLDALEEALVAADQQPANATI